MVTDRQVKRMRRALSSGKTLAQAADAGNMDEKTARKYREVGVLPGELAKPHTWRTREDPFEEVWAEVCEQLEVSPRLQAKTLFEWLLRKYPGRFEEGQLRTFQRGVKRWRATLGPAKEVFFSQVHKPGRLCASDFTQMTSLGVTIQGQCFEHLVYHFVLTYSNWETVTVCFSESFEALSDGLQNALWELGGVPERHRSDRMSSAVNNLSEAKDFTGRYEGLLNHYGLEGEKIQAGKANENGDAESSHRWFKEAVDQALLLRGSRDFESHQAYEQFLGKVLARRNAGRRRRLAEELAVLGSLPERRRESYRRVRVRVGTGSVIHVYHNVYSVDSRLIGEQVDVRVHADHLEVWYGQRQVERLPRLRGRGKHRIDYRHVIDTLVRKPGAFENYRYREDLFPTSRFRMAYDALREARPSRAAREYLRILEMAAKESETGVDEALRELLAQERPITPEAVKELLRREEEFTAVTEVAVAASDLESFDDLFTNKEVWDGFEQGWEACGRKGAADGLLEGAASANVSGEF